MNIKKIIITGIVIFLTLSCIQRSADYYFMKGYRNFWDNNYELAIRYFTRTIAIENKAANAYFFRGMSFGRLGKHEQAIEDLTLVIKYITEDDIRRATVYNNRGIQYFFINEYDKAISDFKTAIKLRPELRGSYYGLVKVYDRQGNWYLSAKYADRIISIDPTFARAYFFRGVGFFYQNKDKEAIEDFNTAIKLGYDSARLYVFFGAVYLFLGNVESALQIFNKGIETHPNSSMLFWSRAGLYEKHLHEYEKAIADFKRAAELGDEEARAVLKGEFGIEDW